MPQKKQTLSKNLVTTKIGSSRNCNDNFRKPHCRSSSPPLADPQPRAHAPLSPPPPPARRPGRAMDGDKKPVDDPAFESSAFEALERDFQEVRRAPAAAKRASQVGDNGQAGRGFFFLNTALALACRC